MRRPSLVIAAALITLAACGGDSADTSSDPSLAPATTSSSTTDDPADAPADDPAEQTTVPDDGVVEPVLFDLDRCEDVPDPADYAEPPTALRPCELPTELVAETVIEGTGEPAEAGDKVIVDYVGVRSLTGEMFDNSFQRGIPLDVTLGAGQVISGWDEGLIGATTGEVRRLDIPTELAYGDNPPSEPIEPGDDLTFVTVVRGVVPATTAEDAPLDLQVPTSEGALETTVDVAVAGDGPVIDEGQTAVVHLLLVRGDNRAVLLNSWERSDAIQIVMEEGYSLPGIHIGMEGAAVGDLRVITMPPADAFGDQGEPGLGLPAGVDLIAVVDVIAKY